MLMLLTLTIWEQSITILILWLTATHSPQNIRLICAGAVPKHNPRKENNSACNCNCRFQTEMVTKRQNLRTAALKEQFGKKWKFCHHYSCQSCCFKSVWITFGCGSNAILWKRAVRRFFKISAYRFRKTRGPEQEQMMTDFTFVGKLFLEWCHRGTWLNSELQTQGVLYNIYTTSLCWHTSL